MLTNNEIISLIGARISAEMADGTVKKTQVFKHLGFYPAS